MSELRNKVEMKIQHHISPLIGWLRNDAVKGRVDTDGLRYNQWKERSALAVDAIVEHVGEVEYEYAIQRYYNHSGIWMIIDKWDEGLLPDYWSTLEEQRDMLDYLKKSYETLEYRIVKRRKAGKVEEL